LSLFFGVHVATSSPSPWGKEDRGLYKRRGSCPGKEDDFFFLLENPWIS
jgi:hypothetical protein